MIYSIPIGPWGSIFAVPTEVVDKHIKLCSTTALRALLILLRNNGKSISSTEIASQLGLSESDAQDALNYWVGAGILSAENAPIFSAQEHSYTSQTTASTRVAESKTTVDQSTGQKVTTHSSRSHLTREDIIELSQTDSNVAVLLREAEGCIGKPLSPMETEVLVYLYSYYNLSIEYLLLVLHYTVNMGKRGLRSFEKLVVSMVEDDIDSYAKAEQFIKRKSSFDEKCKLVKNALGIFDRNLTAREQNYIEGWFSIYHQELPMIKLAFEKTVDNTGKLSFPYMDKILQSWDQKKIHTIEQAKNEKNESSQKQIADRNTSYDIDELEQLITKSLVGEK